LKRLLKITLCLIGIPVLIIFLFLSAVGIYYYRVVHVRPGNLKVSVLPGELGRWVNPFIGTGGYPWVCGNNFPGAALPFGMVRLSPETASILLDRRALNTSGYFYGDNKIIGFSHTRLSGTGATDGGHFLVFPLNAGSSQNEERKGPLAHFSHANEIAFPGYYAVRFSEPGILAELTATQRVGVHRYTFAKGEPPHIFVKITHALGKGRSREGMVRILPAANEIEGSVKTFGTFSGRYGGITVYFVARLDQPFSSFSIWSNGKTHPSQLAAESDDLGADVGFSRKEGKQSIELKLAISYVSVANARTNLDAETGGRDFADISQEAKASWEKQLSLIQIEGGSEKQKTVFYSALYHAFLMPTLFNDVNGDYLGFDKQVHRADSFRYFTDMSLWDTFRTVHPLYTLIAPHDQRDMLVSLVEMCKQGGWLPRWPSGGGYTNSMLGTPADIVIADSYLKGISDFDVEAAYQAMRKTALEPTPKQARYSGREGVEHYLKFGYCPAELMEEAVSRTIEFGWADYAIAQLAKALGRSADATLFAEHAAYYRNLWNPETQYFQPRDTSGTFVEPFKPLLLTYFDRDGKYTNDYVEGSALQWRWGPFYDPEGLISLFKSREYFVSELDAFFAKSDAKMGAWNPGPYYWHGNQPDLHAAYLFNSAGRPDLTQKWVGWILDHKYGDDFNGLDGNDDGGTLSAWYVFSALGFYPLAGTDRYQLGAPLFKEARVRIGENILAIIADKYAPQNIYWRKAWLNDALLGRTYLQHNEIAKGGTLRFEMSSEPGMK